MLRHSTKKPGCKEEVLSYFKQHPDSGVTSPAQIAIVGDRLFTDVMMANLMGSYGFWIKDGIIERKSFVSESQSQWQCEDMLTSTSLQESRIAWRPSCSSEGTVPQIRKANLNEKTLSDAEGNSLY